MFARYGGAFGASAIAHAVVALLLAGSRSEPGGVAPPEKPLDIVVLPPAEDSSFAGLKPVERSNPGWKVGDPGDDAIPGADLQRIAAHAAVLFPFVTPGLAIEAFFPGTGSPTSLVFENPYRGTPAESQPSPGGSLRLDEGTLRAIVDKAWSRGERWKSFATIRDYVARYSPDDEGLARLAGEYRDRNALQPYADGRIRDLRLWAQLGLAADHVTFIGYIRDYARAHPGTRVSTELLLLLDTIAQANQDALATFVESDQPGDLEWTRQAHPRAYLLMRQLQREYTRTLVRLGLTSRSAIDDFYDRGRLAILMGIARTSPRGYRANDANFLIGSILWRQDNRAGAIRAWRELTAPGDEDTYAIAIAQVRAAVRAAAPDARNINYILKNVQGRWLAASDDRLRRFGYRFDRY
jgi:hypothetical protein